MPLHLKRLRVSTLVCHAMLSGCVRVAVCVCMRTSAWRIVVKANVPNARLTLWAYTSNRQIMSLWVAKCDV